MRSAIRKSFRIAAVAAGLAFAGVASADPIATAFNFVPFGFIDCNGAAPGFGDVTAPATSCSAGAPDKVTTILFDNTGLASGDTISLTDPTPLTVGALFEKTWTTALGTFTESLTVTTVSVGVSSLGITASGMISCSGACVGLTSAPVFYSASYTQNGGPGTQINGSFNNSTIRVPEPGTLALLGLGLAGLGFMRRRRS